MSLYRDIGGEGITRAYSIASEPSGNRFDICLNEVEGGAFSPALFRMQPGEALEMKGPYGTFVWRRPVRDTVLVATGTGITPYRSMLPGMLSEDQENRFWLVLGVRFEDGILYRKEFEALAANHANFAFLPTLSRAGDSWKGRRGHVQEHVLELVGDRRDLDVYLCGMKEMVDDLRARLKERGLDRKQIVFEKYD